MKKDLTYVQTCVCDTIRQRRWRAGFSSPWPLLGVEGKAHWRASARLRCAPHLQSGVKEKVSISGDLWSSNGMGLFGIYAYRITKMWVMEKALFGLVVCDDKRSGPPDPHPAAHIY